MSTEKNPIAVIKYQLDTFQLVKGLAIDDDTVAGERLSKTDGISRAVNGFTNFKNFVNLTLHQTSKPLLPKNWDKMTVKDLAALFVMLMICFSVSFAQTSFSLGAARTEGTPALAVGIQWIKNFDSVLNTKTFFGAGKTSFVTFAPNIDVQTTYNQGGVTNLFSSINLKAEGTLATFHTKEVGGYTIPDGNRTFWLFPFSVGAEADNTFKKINGIAEVGVVPWYQGNYNVLPEAIKRTKIGVFLQGGRKFYQDADPEKTILRARGSFAIDTKRLVELQGLGIGVTGTADGWYDFLNQQTYYKVYFSGDVYLDAMNKFSFFYQRGVGAPNFYEGDLYGIALKVHL